MCHDQSISGPKRSEAGKPTNLSRVSLVSFLERLRLDCPPAQPRGDKQQKQQQHQPPLFGHPKANTASQRPSLILHSPSTLPPPHHHLSPSSPLLQAPSTSPQSHASFQLDLTLHVFIPISFLAATTTHLSSFDASCHPPKFSPKWMRVSIPSQHVLL